MSNVLPPAVLEAMNSFDRSARDKAIDAAAKTLEDAAAGESGLANIHLHTFFSYNCLDYSPSRIVWEGKRLGLDVVGSTDFDVLDAMEEMYDAGDRLDIRTTVSLETRTYVADYADREINSPGEPGVMYTMGAGFVRLPAEGTGAARLFASLLDKSARRNRAMIEKVNAATRPVEVDYDRDVLPLTPSGNATERHICQAYDTLARTRYPDADGLAAYWAGVLGMDAADVLKTIPDVGAFRNLIRAKLMKMGGVGYVKPGIDSFPPVRDFFRMAADCGAAPCLAWLDGGSAGEADPGLLLDDAIGWGARVVNVVPERNWNIANPDAKAKKLAALDAFVKAARERNLPVLVGTEMNSPGQKFVDSFDAPELAPYVGDFRDAAFWLYGHTLLERVAGRGVMSEWAGRTFRRDWGMANEFYAVVGRKAAPADMPGGKLAELAKRETPAEVLALL